MIEFLKRGLLTTVQDIGRYGYQRMGINVAGAMDELALALANILVGNAPETEALEVTVLGPTLNSIRQIFLPSVALILAPG